MGLVFGGVDILFVAEVAVVLLEEGGGREGGEGQDVGPQPSLKLPVLHCKRKAARCPPKQQPPQMQPPPTTHTEAPIKPPRGPSMQPGDQATQTAHT